MRRVSHYDASRQTVAYKHESLGDAQYYKRPSSSEHLTTLSLGMVEQAATPKCVVQNTHQPACSS